MKISKLNIKICNEAELINPAIGFIKKNYHTGALKANKNSFPANLKLSLEIQSNGTDFMQINMNTIAISYHQTM